MASLHAAAMRIELRIPTIGSLKAKRSVVKSIVSRLVRSYHIAAAEVDHHDLWQRAAIGVAAVANSAGQVERILHTVERDLRTDDRVEVLAAVVAYLEDPL